MNKELEKAQISKWQENKTVQRGGKKVSRTDVMISLRPSELDKARNRDLFLCLRRRRPKEFRSEDTERCVQRCKRRFR